MRNYKKILFPVDLRDSLCEQVVSQGLNLLEGDRGSIIFLQVVPFIVAYENNPAVLAPIEEVMNQQKVDAEKIMKDFILAKKTEGIEMSGEVVIGDPAEAILKVADEKKADMIMMGTHGRTGVAKLFLGSVAEKVVRSSPIPVITIRP